MFYILYYVIATVIAGILIIRKVDPAELCSHDVTCRILALSDSYPFGQSETSCLRWVRHCAVQ